MVLLIKVKYILRFHAMAMEFIAFFRLIQEKNALMDPLAQLWIKYLHFNFWPLPLSLSAPWWTSLQSSTRITTTITTSKIHFHGKKPFFGFFLFFREIEINSHFFYSNNNNLNDLNTMNTNTRRKKREMAKNPMLFENLEFCQAVGELSVECIHSFVKVSIF